ncbi:MAG: GNAT family N-acetyltransferase [Oscillospiraceae bacterium]|nr:GNAT family N-acetyltransferase [Oscillospiraceae bacterium]
MGVLPAYHRRGIGRLLLTECEEYARDSGMRYLSVKTLTNAHPSKSYAKTRAFYEAASFVSLEIFPLHWDADNPCLVMVKSL